MAMKVGELNGRWSLLVKLTVSLVPVMFVMMLTGIVYQIRENAINQQFRLIGDRYTVAMAVADREKLKDDFTSKLDALHRLVDNNRMALQSATPEADRRLKSIEVILSSVQSDIVSMRVSLAQIRINNNKNQSAQP